MTSPQSTYTINEARDAGYREYPQGTVIKGHVYVWLKEYSVYMLLPSEPIFLTSKESTEEVSDRLREDDERNLSKGQVVSAEQRSN